MEQLPLISVIVPVYNVEPYLNQCVASITAQTYQNLEMILVDDGSTDRSGQLCDQWAQRDSRVQVIHKCNAGAGAARNTGLDAAKGELIAFVDSDDYLSPDMYAHLYGMMADGADIAECGYARTDGDDAQFDCGTGWVQYYTAQEAMLAHIWETAFQQVIWNKLYRRQMIAQIRFPIGQKIDDEFFTYQVLGNAKRLVRSDKVCYAYRQQPNSVMHQKFSLRQVQSLIAKQNRLRYIAEMMPQLQDQAKAELVLNCIYIAQGCRRWLSGCEREQATSMIHSAMCDTLPLKTLPEISRKKKALIWIAQRNVEVAAAILNALEDIHVLS